MPAAARALLIAAVAVAALLVGTAHGATYTVGAPSGSWDTRTDYTRWASGITFRAGDQLVFKYNRAAHDVVEVSRADYDACSASRPVATFTTGDDAVPLPAAGVTRYFICGVPGHCDAGMKLAVRVQAAAAAAPGAAPAPGVAPAPRGAARPPMAATPGGRPAVPPSSSAAPAAARSVVGLSLAAAVVGLVMAAF